jgi:hypothetical protein
MGHDLNAREHAKDSDSDENQTCAQGLEPSEMAVRIPFVRMHLDVIVAECQHK